MDKNTKYGFMIGSFRKHFILWLPIFMFAGTTIFIASCGTNNGDDLQSSIYNETSPAESWVLKTSYRLINDGYVQNEAKIEAKLDIDQQGNVTGKGQIQVIKHPPLAATGVPCVEITDAEGNGSFSIKGKTFGPYLSFWFEDKEITLNGKTIKFAECFGHQSEQPFQDKFNPSMLTGTEMQPESGVGYEEQMAVVLEREEGSSSRQTTTLGTLKTETSFTLEKRQGFLAPPTVEIDANRKWKLSYSGREEYGSSPASNQGGCMQDIEVEFKDLRSNGIVWAKGNFVEECTYSTKKRQENTFLLLGRIENRSIKFRPAWVMQRTYDGNGRLYLDFGQGMGVIQEPYEVVLPLQDNAERAVDQVHNDPGGTRTRGTWRLSGEERQRWRAIGNFWEIDGFKDVNPIMTKEVRFDIGLNVEFDLVKLNGHWKYDSGKTVSLSVAYTFLQQNLFHPCEERNRLVLNEDLQKTFTLNTPVSGRIENDSIIYLKWPIVLVSFELKCDPLPSYPISQPYLGFFESKMSEILRVKEGHDKKYPLVENSPVQVIGTPRYGGSVTFQRLE